MFRALALRLVPVFTLLFGMLAFSVSAEARRDDRFQPGFDVQLREQVQAPRQNPRKAKARKKSKAYAHYRTRHYALSKQYARSKAYAKAKRHHGAHAKAHSQTRHHGVAGTLGSVVASVDLKAQRMVVKVNGEIAHVWKVSTARKGFITPRGVYGPQRMHVSYFSKKYYNSPMPYAIFFKGGYAVHGTGAVKALGAPASHGCIRLATGNARALFQLVKQHGAGRARIVIS